MAALLQAHEPENTSLDRLGASQETVVLEQGSLSAAQSLGDVLALLLGKHNTLEGVVKRNVVVECARVLGGDVEVDTESAESAAVDRVGVSDAVDLWAGLVHSVVDHVGCLVEQTNIAAIDDLALGVDAEEITTLQEWPGDTEWVDPEGRWLNWILCWVSR